MATKTWTGAVSADWNTAGNWSPPGVPGSGDDVVIATTTNAPSLVASATINTPTLNVMAAGRRPSAAAAH